MLLLDMFLSGITCLWNSTQAVKIVRLREGVIMFLERVHLGYHNIHLPAYPICDEAT